jgi:CBS domain-containing protein
MKVIDAVRRSGVGVGPDRTIHDEAVLMEQAGVGSLAVIDGERLVGIVTDRDLVRRALAQGLSPEARVDGVMSTPVVTIDADAELHDAFEVFGTHALRRLAVTRGAAFVGTVTVDDLLVDLVGHLADLTRPITAEVLFAHHDSAPLATT